MKNWDQSSWLRSPISGPRYSTRSSPKWLTVNSFQEKCSSSWLTPTPMPLMEVQCLPSRMLGPMCVRTSVTEQLRMLWSSSKRRSKKLLTKLRKSQTKRYYMMLTNRSSRTASLSLSLKLLAVISMSLRVLFDRSVIRSLKGSSVASPELAETQPKLKQLLWETRSEGP